jgi:hypothetical protein
VSRFNDASNIKTSIFFRVLFANLYNFHNFCPLSFKVYIIQWFNCIRAMLHQVSEWVLRVSNYVHAKKKRLCNVLVSHIPLSIFNCSLLHFCTWIYFFFFIVERHADGLTSERGKNTGFHCLFFFKALTWSWFLFISHLNLTIERSNH